jgi:hypothetical protein
MSDLSDEIALSGRQWSEIERAIWGALKNDLDPSVIAGRLSYLMGIAEGAFRAGVAAAEADRQAAIDAAVQAERERVVITTREERSALPPETIVRSAAGTIACRHYSGMGVLFGSGTPIIWHDLALPLTIIWPLDAQPTEGGQ